MAAGRLSALVLLVLLVPLVAGMPGIMFVPGIAGSGLYAEFRQARISECSSNPLVLPRTRLWAAIWEALPPLHRQQCLVAKMGLQYSKKCRNRFSERRTQIPQIQDELIKAAEGFKGWEPDLAIAGEIRPLNFMPSSPFKSWFIDCQWIYHPPEGAVFFADAGLRGIDYLDYFDGVGVYGTKYFHDLISAAKNIGLAYDDMLAFPYDWRLPFWQIDTTALKASIEKWVEEHPGRKVAIVAHSLGCVIVTRFLNQSVSSEWKKKHIDSFVAIAGAFGGSLKAIRSLLSGYDGATSFDFFGLFNVSFLPPLLLRQGFRTFGSMYALTAHPRVFDGQATIISIANELPQSCDEGKDPHEVLHCLYEKWKLDNSLLREIKEFLRKLWNQIIQFLRWIFRFPVKIPGQYSILNWWTLLPKNLQKKAQQALDVQIQESDFLLSDPQIPVICLWGNFSYPSTEIGFRYATRNIDIPPNYILGYGDGTVPVESASFCTSWKSTVAQREFTDVEHMHMVQNEGVIQFALSELMKLS